MAISHLSLLIKERRQKKSISQANLAKLLGWKSGQFISNIENGKSEYPKECLEKIATALDIPSRDLYKAYLQDCEQEFKGRF